MFCLFMSFVGATADSVLSEDERKRLAALLRHGPGAVRANILTPADARDRYYDDGPPPMLTVQVYFNDLGRLERAIRADGWLAAIRPENFASLRHARGSHQVMWTRAFPVSRAPGEPRENGCAYLVHYHGEAEDLNDWLGYYIGHHPDIMARFPAIRGIEIYTRVDWIDGLPWTRVDYYQRNRILFDSATALKRALNSPTRDEMKADRALFPPFYGKVVHVPMESQTIVHGSRTSM